MVSQKLSQSMFEFLKSKWKQNSVTRQLKRVHGVRKQIYRKKSINPSGTLFISRPREEEGGSTLPGALLSNHEFWTKLWRSFSKIIPPNWLKQKKLRSRVFCLGTTILLHFAPVHKLAYVLNIGTEFWRISFVFSSKERERGTKGGGVLKVSP